MERATGSWWDGNCWYFSVRMPRNKLYFQKGKIVVEWFALSISVTSGTPSLLIPPSPVFLLPHGSHVLRSSRKMDRILDVPVRERSRTRYSLPPRQVSALPTLSHLHFHRRLWFQTGQNWLRTLLWMSNQQKNAASSFTQIKVSHALS